MAYDLLEEECESGQGDWTTGVGSPNYADTSAPLRGSKSFSFANGTNSEYAYHSISASGTVYFFLQELRSANGDNRLITLNNSGTMLAFLATGNGHVFGTHGSSEVDWTAVGFTDFTTPWYIWGKYVKASASPGGDGVFQIWVGQNTDRPASPLINIATGTSAADVNRIVIGLANYGSNITVTVDQLYCSTTEFTSVDGAVSGLSIPVVQSIYRRRR